MISMPGLVQVIMIEDCVRWVNHQIIEYIYEIENEIVLAALHKGEKNTCVPINLVPGAGTLSCRVAPCATQTPLPSYRRIAPSLTDDS